MFRLKTKVFSFRFIRVSDFSHSFLRLKARYVHFPAILWQEGSVACSLSGRSLLPHDVDPVEVAVVALLSAHN